MALSGHAIFCDDIRQEINGKYILLGVYTGTMAVTSFPTNQRVCAFVRLDALPAGHHVFEYSTAEGATFGSFGVELEPDPDAQPPFYLPTPPIGISVSQPATFRLRTRSESETEWVELASLPIVAAEEPIKTPFEM